MRRPAVFFPFGLSGVALGTLSGCGDPRNRQEVTGEVTLHGRPLDDGIIQFAPVDGQETGDGAQIVNGKYRIPKEKGLSPGKYKVTIYGGDGKSRARDAPPHSPPPGAKARQERVPARYTKQAKVGQGSN